MIGMKKSIIGKKTPKEMTRHGGFYMIQPKENKFREVTR
jgi:hypothetical protein